VRQLPTAPSAGSAFRCLPVTSFLSRLWTTRSGLPKRSSRILEGRDTAACLAAELLSPAPESQKALDGLLADLNANLVGPYQHLTPPKLPTRLAFVSERVGRNEADLGKPADLIGRQTKKKSNIEDVEIWIFVEDVYCRVAN
jgi:hypothetical protein